jgi:rare lipoprotein A
MHEVMRALVMIAVFAVTGCPTTRPKAATTTHETTKKPKKPKKKKVAKKPKAPKKVATADEPDDTTPGDVVKVITGRAVWYGADWQGKATASGERFDRHKMTAAHRSLKMGTRVRVTNENNGKSVVVRINDRGPYGKDKRRIIDVSEAAAKKLDFIDAGWCPVTLEVLGEADETE